MTLSHKNVLLAYTLDILVFLLEILNTPKTTWIIYWPSRQKSPDALVYELGFLSGVSIAHLHSNHSAMIKMTNELLIQMKQDLALYW